MAEVIDEATDTTSGGKFDAELLIAQRILRLLEDLTPAGRRRVSEYLHDRYVSEERREFVGRIRKDAKNGE